MNKNKEQVKKKKEDCWNWPFLFSKLLSPREQAKIKNILPSLRDAQLFLWRSLNIYDDFFDGQGKITELVQANNYLRRYLKTHYLLNLNKEYYTLLNKLFLEAERANQREINSRLISMANDSTILFKNIIKPDPANLANKSLILALGAIAPWFYLRYLPTDKKVIAALNFWRYFLSAKQLSDDSRDWLEDLKNGLVTSANEPIIRAAKIKNVKLNFNKIDNNLYLLFIREASPLIIKNIKKLCRQATKEIKKINPGKPAVLILNKLIKPLESACLKSEKFISLSGLDNN